MTATTAWAKDHGTPSHAELNRVRAMPWNAMDCTAKKPKLAVLPHDSRLRSSAVAGGAEAGAATSALANMSNAPTAPAAPAQRTECAQLDGAATNARHGGGVSFLPKAPADPIWLDFDLIAATPTPAALPPATSDATTTSSSWDERLSAYIGDLRSEVPVPKVRSPAPMSLLDHFASAINVQTPGYVPSLIFAA